MAGRLSSSLVLIRAFQLVAALVAGSMNGFLVAWIFVKKLGSVDTLTILEVLICTLLGHTTQALIGGRHKQIGWLIYLLVCDAIFTGVCICLVTLLARAGVPTHCGGLSSIDYKSGNQPENPPPPGYSTIGFSSVGDPLEGVLDRFCAFERSVYFITVGLIFTFMISTVLTTLRICEGYYTKNTTVAELTRSLERNQEKDEEQYSPLLATPTTFERRPLPPSSEGIITRQTSVRSDATSAHTHAVTTSNPYRATSAIPRRPVPNRSLSVISSHSIDSQHSRANSYDSEANNALIADGMQHVSWQQQQQHRGHTMPMLLEEEDNNEAQSAMVSNGMQSHNSTRNHASLQHYEQQQQGTRKAVIPLVSQEDEASAALVSDGMRRPPSSLLPPYSSRMTGHADEDNDTRLSEYVKGQTRAQDMKDSDGF